jgi:S-adenosylmethionine:tRNA ribosyltransferase-isomerase
MKLSDFDFELPKKLIAQTPANPRNHSRLLVYNRTNGRIIDDYFYNLSKYLVPDTTLVLNNSKVEKTRLLIGGLEVFILERLDTHTVRALVRPGKKFLLGNVVDVEGVKIDVLAIDEDGVRTLRFNTPIKDKLLDKFRHVPLPPYIAQDDSLSASYQTVYAKPPGSKAAPTAGLHFTPEQLSDINHIFPVTYITLHVGLGTFAPLKTENFKTHRLHSERFDISKEAANVLDQAKHITAVGTTTARVLESVDRPFNAVDSTTEIFITPGYKFKAVDSLVTNFHLPKSSLLMLVSALVGSADEMQRIYAHAIAQDYRFYSFGDAMLII